MDKAEISGIIAKHMKNAYVTSEDSAILRLRELADDIRDDSYTVVVMGEFKRGKSTFINSLLRTSLLPMDVLPETATINVLRYAEEKTVNVCYLDGRIEAGDPSYDFLKSFSANNKSGKAEEVKFIEIGYPIELLKNHIVLVDTPGVSDLNNQRCEVTYGFVPKANAVIFLLDAVSPLKATEKEFIEEKLFPQGVNNIIFVANRYDFVDEDEEEDVLDELHSRLSKAFHVGERGSEINNIELFPLSALEALKAVSTGNKKQLQLSGLPAIEAKLREMLSSKSIEEEKAEGYKNRLSVILRAIERNLENDKAMKQASVDELNHIKDMLEQLYSESLANKKSISQYVEAQKQIMYSMANKSIQYFVEKLQEDVTDMIAGYQGTGFKEFIEHSVVRKVKNNFETWLAMYSPHIDHLMKSLGNELAMGLSYFFRQNVRLDSGVGHEVRSGGFNLTVEAEDISSVNLQAGALAALGGIGMMAVIGGTVMPLISFAALPFLRDSMLKKKLTMAKIDAEPEIMSHITLLSHQMRNEVHKYIDERCKEITSNTELVYDRIIGDCRERVDAQIIEKNAQGQEIQKDISILDDELNEIRSSLKLL